jgi:uncharacterized protein YjiS (DUF1127 family)
MSTHPRAASASFPFTSSPESRVVDLQACLAVARTMRALAFIRLAQSTAALLDRWVIEAAKQWNARRQMRKSLMGLDDRLLADIGVNRWEIPLIVADAVRAADELGAAPIATRAVTMAATSGTPANDEAHAQAA